jgi:hypothetical protein
MLLAVGALVSWTRRIAWAMAIAVARVGFQDTASRAGVFGERTQWLPILALSQPYQAATIVLAVALNATVYVAIMSLGYWMGRHLLESGRRTPARVAQVTQA